MQDDARASVQEIDTTRQTCPLATQKRAPREVPAERQGASQEARADGDHNNATEPSKIEATTKIPLHNSTVGRPKQEMAQSTIQTPSKSTTWPAEAAGGVNNRAFRDKKQIGVQNDKCYWQETAAKHKGCAAGVKGWRNSKGDERSSSRKGVLDIAYLAFAQANVERELLRSTKEKWLAGAHIDACANGRNTQRTRREVN